MVGSSTSPAYLVGAQSQAKPWGWPVCFRMEPVLWGGERQGEEAAELLSDGALPPLGLTYLPLPPQNLLPAPVVLTSVHELDLFR